MVQQPPSVQGHRKLNAPQASDNAKGIRPRSLDDFLGQPKLKKNLNIFMKAAQKRKEPLDHVLFHGPPGLGKTTLAHILGQEMAVAVKVTSGPTLEKQGDIAAILTNLKDGDILFIDEIHRLKSSVEEVLYSAMEDFGFDIILGKGPSARTMRLALPHFTLVGATTKLSMISSPLRDRFGTVFKLDFYTPDEIAQVIQRTAIIMKCDLDAGAARALAECSRSTPRIANRLLRRVRDFAEVHGYGTITHEIILATLNSLGIDALGLDHTDRNLLSLVVDKFSGGPVGLNSLAAALSEQESTIEDVYEPYLIQLGFLERTPRGRIVKQAAYTHLGLPLIS
jgi:holliday junction DNA helicase RuvB